MEGREPIWSLSERAPRVTGMRNDRREVLVTTLDAEPQHLYELPGPTIWPLVLALTSALGREYGVCLILDVNGRHCSIGEPLRKSILVSFLIGCFPHRLRVLGQQQHHQ